MNDGTRILATVVAVVSVAMTTAACGGDASTEGRETITFQLAGEPEEVAVYEQLVAAFERAEPTVDVELVGVARKDDHLQRLVTSFAAGAPPDVFLVNFREFSQFVVRGAIEPVAPYVEQAGIDLDAYYREPLEAFTYGGTLQCFPQNISNLVVYYNRALFAAAGVPHPGSWTWQEFADVARRLTTGEVHGVGIDPQVIRLAPFVWGNGGDLVDDLARPSRFTLDTPEAREAIELVLSLVRDGAVPDREEVAAQDLETRFVTGKLAMVLSSRKDTPVFREVRGLDWDVAPLPVVDRPASILHADAYCLAAGGDPDVAARFMAFAVSAEGQTITALGGRTVPSLRSVAAGPFLDPIHAPAHAQVFLDAIPHLRRTPVIPTWPEIEDVAEDVLTELFAGELSLDEALATLDRRTRPLFAEGTAELP